MPSLLKLEDKYISLLEEKVSDLKGEVSSLNAQNTEMSTEKDRAEAEMEKWRAGCVDLRGEVQKLHKELMLFAQSSMAPCSPPKGECFCAEPYAVKPCISMPCGHVFHKECALKHAKSNRDCALCRAHPASAGIKRARAE